MSALAGLRVLDLSRVLAGPYCTQMLADLGATVWKIEPLWGDETRSWGPPFIQKKSATPLQGEGLAQSARGGGEPDEHADWKLGPEGESAYYLSVNRGKKSVAVNLKDPRGAELVRRLAAKADVLVENYKVGDLARYGLDYATLSALNPRLVYLSVTGYGQTGPRSGEPGYDVAVQGLIGIMSVTGEPQGPPLRVPVAWIDLMTGMNGAVAVLAALLERQHSGLGQHIDLALFDVGLAAMANLAQSFLLSKKLPARLGNAHPQIVPYGAFQASDGYFMLTVGNDEQYRKFCGAIQHPELWEDSRFQTNPSRVLHREELVRRLSEILRERPRSHWLGLLRAAGVPATPVNNLAEAFADPQAEARHLRYQVEHPTLGTIPLIGSPLAHLSRTPATIREAPPLLGEDTLEVLSQELGMSEGEVLELAHAGVLRISTIET